MVLDEVREDRQTSDRLPRGVIYALIVLTTAAMLPLALAAKARHTKSREPRIHLIGDMDWQPKYKAQRKNPVFDDGRARASTDGRHVAVGELREDDQLYRGKVDGELRPHLPGSDPAHRSSRWSAASSVSASTARLVTACRATATAWSPSAPTP